MAPTASTALLSNLFHYYHRAKHWQCDRNTRTAQGRTKAPSWGLRPCGCRAFRAFSQPGPTVLHSFLYKGTCSALFNTQDSPLGTEAAALHLHRLQQNSNIWHFQESTREGFYQTSHQLLLPSRFKTKHICLLQIGLLRMFSQSRLHETDLLRGFLLHSTSKLDPSGLK